MTQYVVNLTEAEDKALSYVALSQEDWIVYATKDRARIATEEIVKIVVEKCLENNIQIPNTKDAMVSLAFEKNWVKSVAQKQQEYEESKL
jgi:hypothetical protein